MTNPISELGFKVVQFVQHLGRIGVFAGNIATSIVTPPMRFGAFARELYKLGVLSLVIIVVCGTTVGMVLALQGYHTLARFGAAANVGGLVGAALIRELGPVLTALLITGRAGSAATAELGAMNATEQLDGLRMLSINPIHLVVTPKALAMFAILPLLTAIFILSGIFGGYIVDAGLMGGDPGFYSISLHNAITFRDDVAGCFIKSAVFGLLIGLIATYRGYTATPNAEGVSSDTTSTVVTASVCVLLADYVVTALWGV